MFRQAIHHPPARRASWGCCALLVVLAGAAGLSAGDSARPPQVGFLGVWDRAAPLLERASRQVKLPVVFFDNAQPLPPQELAQLRVLLVLNLPRERVPKLLEELRQAKKQNPDLRVVPLDARDVHANLKRAGLLDPDPEVPRYWRAGGALNLRRLLVYVGVKYLGRKEEVQPPVEIPQYGYYHPEAKELATTLRALQEQMDWSPQRPTAVMLIQQSFWITEDTQVIDAQLRALEQVGFNSVAVFADSLARLRQMLRELKPAVLVEDRHGSMWQGDGHGSLLEELDVPYLRPISMLAYTIQQWRDDPRGLHPRDVSHFLTLQESKGTIEPIVVGGLKESVRGFRLHVPVPERVQRFAQRAWAWYQLRCTPNRQKRLCIVYYNRTGGQDDLLRGSPTGAFLDGPRSLVRFLPRLKERGWHLTRLPRDEAELLAWVRRSGRNIGPWAPQELERLADQPGVVLVSLEKFRRWMDQHLKERHRQALEKHFGPPPGKLMVVRRNGQPHLVLPGVDLGHVWLGCLPLRGERQDQRLLHSRDVPPPYNYLAFYWYLQHEWKPHAVVHWGTHGTVELLPGKEAGLSEDDWSDICLGRLPVVNLWITDNLGEATLSRRRSYALLVDHLVPPTENAGLSGPLRQLHDSIDKFQSLEPGLLRQEFRRKITQAVHENHLDETLKLVGLPQRLLTDQEIHRVAEYLHELYNAMRPEVLHVLGQPPEERRLARWLVAALGEKFLDRLALVAGVPPELERFPGDRLKHLRRKAEQLVRRVLWEDRPVPPELAKDLEFARGLRRRIEAADQEIENLLRALEGRFVPPGPGPDPVRNPASVPTGRNLYGLNPEEIPTPASWAVAVKLVDQMLRTRQVRKVGIDLNGMNTMRDFGVMEGQILYLLGVQPVWDANGLAIDVELIPRQELGRPRIDVFIAMGGMYKENFPTRVRLLDKAVRLAAAAREPDNLVRRGTEQLRQRLLARGFAARQAEHLAAARIFGTKPGNTSGTNILHLVPRSGVWSSDDEIAAVYIDNMSYVFTDKLWGEKVPGLYEEAIQGTDTVLRVWASNMTSQLSNHHAYEYLGGLSMAVRKLTGREPQALIADVRSPNAARLRDFEEVLATNLRTELLNENWIRGMKSHDYAGAGMMAELVKNTFGWNVTRPGSVGQGTWEEIYRTYIQDRYRLGLREWFDRVNPHARQEIAAVMLEAVRKGYWRPDQQVVRHLAREFAQSVARHGLSAGLTTGGNRPLERFVAEQLRAVGDVALAGRFQQAVRASAGAPADEQQAAAEKVYGPKLEKTRQQTPSAPVPRRTAWGLALAAAVLVLLAVLGAWRGWGVPR